LGAFAFGLATLSELINERYLTPAASSLRMPPSQPRVSPHSHVSASSRNDIHTAAA
jgi:hypothetical protein